MKIFLITAIFFITLFFPSCGGDTAIPLDEKGREDFIAFHQKFYRDSAFQMTRIEFPLLGQNPDGSQERFFWDVDNWKIQKALDPNNKDIEFVPFYDMEDLMRERILVQKRFMIENLFSLIDNKWYLTQYSGIKDIGSFKKKESVSAPPVDTTSADSSTVE